MELSFTANKIRHIYTKVLFYAFFVYGILYFMNPEMVYDSSSKIKYVRYIIIALIWMAFFRHVMTKKIVTYFVLSIVLAIDAFFAGLNGAFDIINVINFLLPISCFFLYDKLEKQQMMRIVEIVYVISSLFTYLECFVLHGVYSQFSHSGYRAASIFNSPNTYGCFLVYMSIILLYDPSVKVLYRIIVTFNNLLLAYLTGSRASLLVLLVTYCVFIIQLALTMDRVKRKTLYYILLGAIIVIIGGSFFWDKMSSISTRAVWNYDFTRLFSLSKDTRTVYNSQFLNAASKDILFPWSEELVYVDNMYFFIWGRFGLHVFALYILLLISVGCEIVKRKQRENFCLYIYFLMFGMVLNYMYLWPNSFVFWYFVADVFCKNKGFEI